LIALKKRILLFILVVLTGSVPQLLNAQKLTLSPAVVDNAGLGFLKIIGQDEEGIFLLFSNLSLGMERDRVGLKTRRYRLAYYTFDLNMKWQVALEAHPDGSDIETVSFFNDRVIVISSTIEKGTSSLQLFAEYYNAKGLINASTKKIGSVTIGKTSYAGKPRTRMSPDKTQLGIILNEERESDQLVHVWYCDTGLHVVKNYNARINYPTRDLDLTEALISDNQQLSILGQARVKESASDRKQTLLFKLFLINDNSKVLEFPVNTTNETMSEASLIVNRKNNAVIVTGFYAENGSFAGTGILYGRLPLNEPDSFRVATIPIRSDAQQKLVGERNNSNGVGLFNYPIQKIILRNDGGAVVVAEAAYLSEYSYYDYFTQSFNRRIEYHFDNIVVLSINARGNIDWSDVIRKEQVSMDDEGYYSSFCAMYDSDRMALIFNDDIGRNNMVVAHMLDNLGQLQVKKLTGISDNITIIPRSGKQVAESLVIVPAISRKRLYLARLEF
jgi:hypothetical protein